LGTDYDIARSADKGTLFVDKEEGNEDIDDV